MQSYVKRSFVVKVATILEKVAAIMDFQMFIYLDLMAMDYLIKAIFVRINPDVNPE